MSENPEQIAARYGAVCRPGLRVTVCPPCRYSHDDHALYSPREAKLREASRKGNAHHVAAGLALYDRIKGRVAVMHATGATHAEMAQAVGVSTRTVRKALTRLGVRASCGAHDG